MPEVLARSLSRTREQTTHHNRTSTKSERLHDVADVADTAVSDDRHAKLASELGHSINSSCLRTSHSHDLLSDTDRARTHADSETVCTRSDEAGSLLASNHIAGDDL